MNPLKNFNLAMRYIEDHLISEHQSREVQVNEAAKIAGCSEDHFRRMFSFLAGMSISEYIRKRRLSLAASLLKNTDEKVIDIALRLGYESPDAFTKAFQSIHGVSPSKLRREAVSVKSYPPVTFQLTVKGGNEMQYRIVEKEPFQIVGIKKRITLVYEGVNPQMDSMWESLTMDKITELKQLSDQEPRGIICASANFEERSEEGTWLDQYIGAITSNPDTGSFDVLPVDASLWAVFSAEGPFPETLQNIWARIYSEWFPISGYESTGGPEVLWNESPDTSLPNYKSEIWIPVRKALMQ